MFDGLVRVLVKKKMGYFVAKYHDMTDIEVTGADNWEKYYLLLCFGQNRNGESYGPGFSTLTSDQLKNIFGKIKNMRQFSEFVDEIEDTYLCLPTHMHNFDVKGLLLHYGVNRKTAIWGTLRERIVDDGEVREEKKKRILEDRNKELEPFRRYAESVKFKRTRVLGGMGVVADGMFVDSIMEYAEKYFLQNGVFPKGRHTIPFVDTQPGKPSHSSNFDQNIKPHHHYDSIPEALCKFSNREVVFPEE